MGTHLRALRESNLMNTNIPAFEWFSKYFILSIGMVKEETVGLLRHSD